MKVNRYVLLSLTIAAAAGIWIAAYGVNRVPAVNAESDASMTGMQMAVAAGSDASMSHMQMTGADIPK